MKRPCICDRMEKGVAFDKTKHCRKCWLFHNNEKYRAKWSEEPSIAEKAINLANETIKYISAGFKNVDDATYQERLKICESCPMKTENWKCKECGCYILIKAKMATAECPLKKWLSTIEPQPKKDCGCKN